MSHRLAVRASRRPPLRASGVLAAVIATTLLVPGPASAQAPTREMIDRGHRMLAQVDKDLRQYYFDSTFGGLDLQARFRAADSAISVAPTNNHVIGAIAQFVSELNDTHTNFAPPGHVARVDYGYQARFVGDTCFIMSVTPASDAAVKGVKRGDALLKLDAFPVERRTFHTVQYVYQRLSPRARVRLTLRSPDGAERAVDVDAKITMGARTVDYEDVETWRRFEDEYYKNVRANHTVIELKDTAVVWRMRGFAGEDQANIDEIMKSVRKARALVLDLRDDGGGRVSTLEYLVGQFFDQPVTVGKFRVRSGDSTWVIKPTKKEPYRGMLVVLVNSGSASCSEIFARLMQLEGRALIVGDRSMGAVVTSINYPHSVGFGRTLDYFTQISIADVVMSDGQRLEGVGVTPDHLVLPSGTDITSRRDPAMAKALSLVGVSVTPEVAGTVYRSGAPPAGER